MDFQKWLLDEPDDFEKRVQFNLEDGRLHGIPKLKFEFKCEGTVSEIAKSLHQIIKDSELEEELFQLIWTNKQEKIIQPEMTKLTHLSPSFQLEDIYACNRNIKFSLPIPSSDWAFKKIEASLVYFFPSESIIKIDNGLKAEGSLVESDDSHILYKRLKLNKVKPIFQNLSKKMCFYDVRAKHFHLILRELASGKELLSSPFRIISKATNMRLDWKLRKITIFTEEIGK